MSWWEWVAAALMGYLAGSVSGTRIVGRFVAPGEDLTITELPAADGTSTTLRGTGATAIAARAGPRYGCLASLIDMAKAAAVALLALGIWPGTGPAHVAAAAAVWGHVFPLYHRLVGGKGMSPMLGGLLVLDWVAIPATSLAGIVVGGAGLGDVFAAYGSGPLFLLPWAIWRGGTTFGAYAVAVNVPYWWSLRHELRDHLETVRADGRTVSERRRALFAQMRDARGEAPWAGGPSQDGDGG